MKTYTCNTQASILVIYITAIEQKTLNDHRVLSLHSPMLPAMCTA